MIRVLFISYLLWFTLTGCSVGPDYVRENLEIEVPNQWTNYSEMKIELAEDSNVLVDGYNWYWWESFGDSVLNNLVENAMAHNNDLAVAAARVLEAQSLFLGANSSQWPTLELGGNASRSKLGQSGSTPSLDKYSNMFSINSTLRYEADLWGRLASSKEAAYASLLASEQDRRTIAQSLIANVVLTWLEIYELQMQVQLNDRTVLNLSDNLEIVINRYNRGLVSALDVHLATQSLASAEAVGPSNRERLGQSKRRLEILMGKYPSGLILTNAKELTKNSSIWSVMPEPLDAVPAGLPSELLERRPDLMAAEFRLHSSVAKVGEARAALYPRISLTASTGTSSNELADLLSTPSNVWSLAGNLLMPLINRGATKAQIKGAEARVLQAVAQYRSTILQAFYEVENALDQDHYQREQEQYLIKSVDQARLSVDLAEDRYMRGLDNILVSLETQRRLYTAESQLLTTQRLHRTARVSLIQALGGPWDNLIIQ